MKKLLIVLLVLGTGALLVFLLEGKTEQLPAEFQDDTDFEVVEKALQEDGKRKVYGSCNAISTASNCIDYVGSIWSENNMAELNCKEVGVFSKNACPYSDFGGCQTSGGSVMEMVAWVYPEGPGEYDTESVKYASAACNAVPLGKWVMPDDFL